MEDVGNSLSPFLTNTFKITVPEYMPVGIVATLVGFIYSGNIIFFNIKIIYAILSVIFIIAGYNTYNAIVDVEIDKINKPHRPLPKALLTIKEAKYITIFSFFLGLLLSLLINKIAFFIVLITTIIAVLYSFGPINLKGKFIFGTLTATSLYTVAFPLIGWSVLQYNKIPIQIISYLFVFGLIVAILKDFEDIIGDSHYEAHTIISYLGYSKTIKLLLLLILFGIILIISFVYFDFLNIYYLSLLIFSGLYILNLYYLNIEKTTKRAKYAFIYSMIIMIIMEILLIFLKVL